MSKHIRFAARWVLPGLFLSVWVVGCGEPAAQSPRPQPVTSKQAEEPGTPVAVQPSPQQPKGEPVEIAQILRQGDTATYRVTTEDDKSVKWEGPDDKKPTQFQGGTTGNAVTVTFEQHIEGVDQKGNATATITIQALTYKGIVRDNIVLDFDSSREQDHAMPLAKLVGGSYKVELTPAGEVTRVIDASGVRKAVQGSTPAHTWAARLVSDEVINRRHTIGALRTDKKDVAPGDTWRNVTSHDFTMLGSKSYERVYTLGEVTEAEGKKVVVAEMKGIPSAQMAEQLHSQQLAGPFMGGFDTTDSYVGRVKLDVEAGAVLEYSEQLDSMWLFAEQTSGQGDQGPAAVRMAARRLYRIERLD